MGRRIRWLGLVLIVCFGLVIVQLTNIQFRQASALAHSRDNPVNRAHNFDNQRGNIFAEDGTLLADSVRIAPKGAPTYRWQRQYPTKSLFAQIVGTCSPVYCDTGVEAYYSSQLGLHKQSAQTLSQLLSPPPPTTDDITLTVNPRLQQAALQQLANLPGPNRDGAIVLINPHTGAIIAMASSPSYDPTPLVSTDFKSETFARNATLVPDGEGFKPLYSIASYYPIQPGSTAKVITTAAIYNLDPSLATYNFPTAACLTNIPDTNQQICNDADTASAASACGGTIIQMLPASCDPGYAKLGLLLGGDTLAQQAAGFGFNAVPPLDLPAGYVQASPYPTAQELSPGGNPGIPGQAYSAFGQQDVLSTALQNALVAAGIANGGAVMAPHFLQKVTDAQGRVVETYQPRVWKQAMSPGAASQVIPLMQAVATSGTASGDGFPRALNVAVKTGTAQVGTPITSVADWMIGFAPANDPKIAIAVVVPFQPLSTQGASIAGPILRNMLVAALG
ncbi:MAG: penicillin-binding transpeptidase domain-containing protein [Acidimicrobiales bacterium]